MGRATGPCKCRIHPESKRGLYFVVFLWPTKDAMLAHFRAEHLHADPDTAAQCSTYTVEKIEPGGRRRRSPLMGEINFHRGYVTTEVLAHEVAHAALGWARRIGLDLAGAGQGGQAGGQGLVSDAEERYCYGLGRMTSQVNNAMYRWGGYGR